MVGETLIVAGAVAGAAFWLARQVLRPSRPGCGCGGRPACGAPIPRGRRAAPLASGKAVPGR
jgi:hypothetical protein